MICAQCAGDVDAQGTRASNAVVNKLTVATIGSSTRVTQMGSPRLWRKGREKSAAIIKTAEYLDAHSLTRSPSHPTWTEDSQLSTVIAAAFLAPNNEPPTRRALSCRHPRHWQ